MGMSQKEVIELEEEANTMEVVAENCCRWWR
jgi:hypothetical protein